MWEVCAVMGRLDCSLPSVIPLPYSEWCLALGATSNASITAYLYHTTTTYLHLHFHNTNRATIEAHTCRMASGTEVTKHLNTSRLYSMYKSICDVLLHLFLWKLELAQFSTFSPFSIICVATSIVLQLLLSLVFVLRAPGKVKGLGGFLLLQPPPSYIPIIISAEYEQPPKIQPDRDLQPLLQVHFSNQMPEIKISHVKKITTKRCSPASRRGSSPFIAEGVSQRAAGPELCLAQREYQENQREYQLVGTNNQKDYFSDLSQKFCELEMLRYECWCWWGWRCHWGSLSAELVCIDALHSGMYSLFESTAKTIRHTEINR